MNTVSVILYFISTNVDKNVRRNRFVETNLWQIDLLILLTKLSNLSTLANIKKELEKDDVAKTVLSLADGSLSSNQLKEKVAKKTNVSKKTAQRRILELIEKGALLAIKKGSEVYYENSGLYQ